ncbi:unnamed protein product [Durusdinium trenchii]|uniref:Apple domain-containing protein n=1 Tax=Durusdinium trenchii TaxID=1381693 RepID=A0ABP0PF73_9DINO
MSGRGGRGGRARPRPPGSSVRVAGFVLNRRLFSTPLALEPRAHGQEYFQLLGPKMPDDLAQFQEVLDIALENLPQVDWSRCANGDANVMVMARQKRVWDGPRAQEAQRPKEPEDEDDVFMNLPHHDDYWPGAEFFVVSDAPFRTLFYPEGPDEMPIRYPAGTVIHYDAQALHSAPGFCPASEELRKARGVSSVVRTFLRISAYDPLWSLSQLSHFASLLQPQLAPAEWKRPTPCEAEDVVAPCFDELHSCARCCDLSKGPSGDAACWAGWMNYEKCCDPASRRWAGCGWQRGADLWAHEYFSLEPPRMNSAAQCHGRCEEDGACGGWTYFPANWQPIGCRLPLAAMFGLRRACVLRATLEAPPSLHAGIVWGYRDCEEPDGCVRYGVDQLGQDVAFLKEVPSIAVCRKRCQEKEECKAFSYFPDSYVGDASPDCVMPAAVVLWWRGRCLMKIGSDERQANAEKAVWLPMGNVASSNRHCAPARPWLLWATHHSKQHESLAVDGDYRREHCVTRQPWRAELDAEYMVSRAMLFTGAYATMTSRDPVTYHVVLVLADGEEMLCGSAPEHLNGAALPVQCANKAAERPVRAVIIHGMGAEGFSLCEVELRVAPVPCHLLYKQFWIIHGRPVHLLPPGEAKRVSLDGAGEACERAGGSFVEVKGRIICGEAACAPSKCLEAFDQDAEAYAPSTTLGLWNPKLESAADACESLQIGTPGRMFEATVMIYNGGRAAVGEQMTTHWGFCAPAHCADDDAAAVATRLVAREGLTWEAPVGALMWEEEGPRFELLRAKPREAFDRITSFLGSGARATVLNVGHSGGEQRDLRESLASTDRARSPEARLVRAVSGESRPDEQAASYMEIAVWCLTGMSGWWSLNIITAELPFFVAELPAGKRLGNLIAVCTQIGNIAPIIYKAATRRRPGNLVVAIGCFQVVAVLSLLASMLLWHSTPVLLVCTVLAGSVGCMSSVTYWAAVAQRPASCVRAMSVGMTLGGLLATGFAATQLGGCEQGDPRFSPEIFFLLAAATQAGQGAMFVWRSCSTFGQNGVAAPQTAGDEQACASEKGPMPRVAKVLMAGCFVVYATTYTMPTLMPFMAGHFTNSTESQQLLLWMQVLQNAGDVLGRLATALVRENRLVLTIWMVLLVASFLVSVLTSVQDVSKWFQYQFAILAMPLTCGLFYFSRGLLVTTFYLYARGIGPKEQVQEITENMGFCGQMGALIANFAAFVLVSIFT